MDKSRDLRVNRHIVLNPYLLGFIFGYTVLAAVLNIKGYSTLSYCMMLVIIFHIYNLLIQAKPLKMGGRIISLIIEPIILLGMCKIIYWTMDSIL